MQKKTKILSDNEIFSDNPMHVLKNAAAVVSMISWNDMELDYRKDMYYRMCPDAYPVHSPRIHRLLSGRMMRLSG